MIQGIFNICFTVRSQHVYLFQHLKCRITDWDWTLLLLIFYTPIGLVLLVFRIFALIQFYLLFLYLPYRPIRK